MPKKCMLCDGEAKFVIKGTNDAYCEECAHESFSDISCLQRIEEQAQRLKELLKYEDQLNEEDLQ